MNQISSPQGHFPGQPATNPKGQINAISLSERELEGPKVAMREDKSEVEEKGDVDKV